MKFKKPLWLIWLGVMAVTLTIRIIAGIFAPALVFIGIVVGVIGNAVCLIAVPNVILASLENSGTKRTNSLSLLVYFTYYFLIFYFLYYQLNLLDDNNGVLADFVEWYIKPFLDK